MCATLPGARRWHAGARRGRGSGDGDRLMAAVEEGVVPQALQALGSTTHDAGDEEGGEDRSGEPAHHERRVGEGRGERDHAEHQPGAADEGDVLADDGRRDARLGADPGQEHHQGHGEGDGDQGHPRRITAGHEGEEGGEGQDDHQHPWELTQHGVSSGFRAPRAWNR